MDKRIFIRREPKKIKADIFDRFGIERDIMTYLEDINVTKRNFTINRSVPIITINLKSILHKTPSLEEYSNFLQTPSYKYSLFNV